MQFSHFKQNKILVVFESNNLVSEENIKNANGLARRNCDICTLKELICDPNIISKYKCMVDCTFDHKIYNGYLNKKKGILIKEEFSFLRTPTNRFVIKAPNISQMTITNFTKSDIIKNKFAENLEDYNNRIQFISLKVPEYKNKQNFENGIKVGIDYSNFVNNKEKRYILINEIPEHKEPGVVYITPNDVDILEKLITVSAKITF